MNRASPGTASELFWTPRAGRFRISRWSVPGVQNYVGVDSARAPEYAAATFRQKLRILLVLGIGTVRKRNIVAISRQKIPARSVWLLPLSVAPAITLRSARAREVSAKRAFTKQILRRFPCATAILSRRPPGTAWTAAYSADSIAPIALHRADSHGSRWIQRTALVTALRAGRRAPCRSLRTGPVVDDSSACSTEFM